MQLREAAHASNGDPIPRRLSLYVHVPFCLSPCFYCGCNRIITRDLSRADTYLARLYREIDLTAALFDRDREVIQLHFGGGTPHFLTPPQLREVVDTLRRQFHFLDSPERDISIEFRTHDRLSRTALLLASAVILVAAAYMALWIGMRTWAI